jgi:hypothetical protein
VKKIIAGGALVLGGLMVSTGIANADEVQVVESYSTLEACNLDGPAVEVNEPGPWTHFDCRQGGDGLWYLFLSR